MSSLVRTTTSLWRLGIIGILIAYPGAASAQPQYAITTLVDVPNVYSAWAHGINDNGQIVGGMKVLNDAPTWAWRQDGGTIVAALRQAVFLRPTLSGYMVVRYRPYSTVLDRTRVVHGVAFAGDAGRGSCDASIRTQRFGRRSRFQRPGWRLPEPACVCVSQWCSSRPERSRAFRLGLDTAGDCARHQQPWPDRRRGLEGRPPATVSAHAGGIVRAARA